MRFGLLMGFGLFFVNVLQAQYTLHIEVDDFRKAKVIFLSGTVNNWNPNDRNYQLKRKNYFRWDITLTNLPAGQYSFKLTKGSLETVETLPGGEDLANRIINLHGDSTVLFSVAGWKDSANDPARFSDSARLVFAMNHGTDYLNSNLDSAYQYALETFTLSAKVSRLLKAYAVSFQGNVLLKLGNTEKALELYEEGIRIRMALFNPIDSGGISYLQNQMGDAYWQMNDTVRALQYYRHAMRLTPPYVYYHPLHESICNRLCNIGRTYLARHQLDSAKWYATQSAQVGDKISAITDLFWGDIEMKETNFNRALAYYRLSIARGLYHDGNLDVVLQGYEKMVQIFLTQSRRDSAMTYARRAFATANALRNSVAVSQSGLLLANLFKEERHFDSAFYYQQKVIESAKKQVSQEQERQALNTYFNEKIKEQEFNAQENEYYARLWLYGLLGALLLVLLAAVLYRLRLKSGYDKKMRAIEMRALRAQMNPHFIFNCLGSINRYIVKSDTRTASSYLTKFAKLIRLILDNSSSDHISLETEIQALQLYLDMESLRFDHGFDYEIEREKNLKEENIQLPSMLIQPYVENAIWHGLLQREEKGKLWIRFKKVNGHTLQAEIEDNGIGRKQAAELKSKSTVKQKSYGMQISSDRIRIINNLYKLNNSVAINDLVDEKGVARGTKIVLKIPV